MCQRQYTLLFEVARESYLRRNTFEPSPSSACKWWDQHGKPVIWISRGKRKPITVFISTANTDVLSMLSWPRWSIRSISTGDLTPCIDVLAIQDCYLPLWLPKRHCFEIKRMPSPGRWNVAPNIKMAMSHWTRYIYDYKPLACIRFWCLCWEALREAKQKARHLHCILRITGLRRGQI